jgi:hypothetical protein
MARISRSTVQRATSNASRRSCRQTFSAPYTEKFCFQTRSISKRSSSSRFARSERRFGSSFQALCS